MTINVESVHVEPDVNSRAAVVGDCRLGVQAVVTDDHSYGLGSNHLSA